MHVYSQRIDSLQKTVADSHVKPVASKIYISESAKPKRKSQAE